MHIDIHACTPDRQIHCVRMFVYIHVCTYVPTVGPWLFKPIGFRQWLSLLMFEQLKPICDSILENLPFQHIGQFSVL